MRFGGARRLSEEFSPLFSRVAQVHGRSRYAPESFPHFSHDKLLIVDFGRQVTQLIARRVREAGVYCEIAPFQSAEAAFDALKPKAVILSGGPASVPDEGSPRAPQAIFEAGVPVLGICYGQMTMAEQLGGAVESGHHREFGRAEVAVGAASPLLEGCGSPASATSCG